MWGHPRPGQQLGSFLACWLSRNEVAMDSSLWEVCRPEKPVESQCRGFLCPPPPSQAIISAKMEQTPSSHGQSTWDFPVNPIPLSPEALFRIVR